MNVEERNFEMIRKITDILVGFNERISILEKKVSLMKNEIDIIYKEIGELKSEIRRLNIENIKIMEKVFKNGD